MNEISALVVSVVGVGMLKRYVMGEYIFVTWRKITYREKTPA